MGDFWDTQYIGISINNKYFARFKLCLRIEIVGLPMVLIILYKLLKPNGYETCTDHPIPHKQLVYLTCCVLRLMYKWSYTINDGSEWYAGEWVVALTDWPTRHLEQLLAERGWHDSCSRSSLPACAQRYGF